MTGRGGTGKNLLRGITVTCLTKGDIANKSKR